MADDHDFGAEGSRITGSIFLRAYCRNCGEPIRVHEKCTEAEKRCIYCWGSHPPAPHTGLTPRQRHKLGKTDGG